MHDAQFPDGHGEDSVAGLRRRATWRQPAGEHPADPDPHGDDALADALAAELASVTSSIPVITPEMLRRSVVDQDDLFAALMADDAPAPELHAPATPGYAAPEPPAGPEPQPFEPAPFEPAPSQPASFEPEPFDSEPFEPVPFEPVPFEPVRAERAQFEAEVPAPQHVPAASPEGFEEGYLPAEPPSTARQTQPEPEPFLPSEPPQYAPGDADWRDLALHPHPVPSEESVPFAAPIASPFAPPAEPVMQHPMPDWSSAPPPVWRVEPAVRIEPTVRAEPPSVPPSTAPPLDIGAFLQAAPPPVPDSIAVPPPGSDLPPPPHRRSLDDDALATVLSRAGSRLGVAGALAELEMQMQLRQEDAREFASWERSLRAIGTPEALDAIARAAASITSFEVPDGVGSWAAAPGEQADAAASPETFDEADAVPPSVDGLDEPVPAPTPESLPPEADPAPSEPEPEPESQPVPVTPMPETPEPTAPVLAEQAASQRMFSIEANDGAPTPAAFRTGRGSRMLAPWFLVNSSVVSVAVGAIVFGLGLSARQALVSVIAGVALSLLPLGLATLAGKWSGQPTMVTSRAAFGVVGNIVPAILAVVARVFWAAVALWLIGTTASGAIAGAATDTPWVAFAASGAAMVIALAVAFFGHALLMRLTLVLAVIAAVLVAGVVALAAPQVDVRATLSVGDGSWVHVITGAVLVFSVVGLAWANGGAEVARYQRSAGSGAASMAWTIVGVTAPALALLCTGVLLAASNEGLAAALAADPLEAFASVLPSWSPVPLAVAAITGLVGAVALSFYSGAFSLQAAGLLAPRHIAVVVIALIAGAAAAALILLGGVTGDFLLDAVITLAVPVAAWTGIVAGDLMIRRTHLDGAALMRRGGRYGNANWINLAVLVFATAIGLGLVSASTGSFAWQGFLWPFLGLAEAHALTTSDVGVLAALVLGLLAPLVAGVPRARRQENAAA